MLHPFLYPHLRLDVEEDEHDAMRQFAQPEASRVSARFVNESTSASDCRLERGVCALLFFRQATGSTTAASGLTRLLHSQLSP